MNHLMAVERLVAEQAEAWRYHEISASEAALSLRDGLDFLIGIVTHATREKGLEVLPPLTNALHTLCDNNPAGAEAALLLMASPDGTMLRQPLLGTPLEEAGDAVVALLMQALQMLRGAVLDEPDGSEAPRQREVIQDLLAVLVTLLPEYSAARRTRRSVGAAYVSLLRQLGEEPAFAGELHRACPTSATRRLLSLYVEDPTAPPPARFSPASSAFHQTGYSARGLMGHYERSYSAQNGNSPERPCHGGSPERAYYGESSPTRANISPLISGGRLAELASRVEEAERFHEEVSYDSGGYGDDGGYDGGGGYGGGSYGGGGYGGGCHSGGGYGGGYSDVGYGGAYSGYDDDRLTTGDGPTGLIYPNGSSYSVDVGREEVDD